MPYSSIPLVLLLLLTAACSGPVATTIEPAFPLLTFSRPVDFQHAGDGTNRVFVVEQQGMIHVFDNDPTTEQTGIFLDIENLVNDRGNEEGLLGLAFHPDYAVNGRFFVYHSMDNPQRTVLAAYQVSDEPNRADPTSRRILLEINQPYRNHNGGQIAFGPDGYLYIGVGDGGSRNDPQEHGQNPASLLGKILRIDVDSESNERAYGIPATNPFANATNDHRQEIFALGLRNPWRFSFDPETGKLWVGDVGQNDYEEIALVDAGENHGWNTMEGSHCFDPKSGCSTSGLTLPVLDYGRRDGGSVTGGFVYQGSIAPELVGNYIYADFASGKIWMFKYRNNAVSNHSELDDTGLNISSFGIDEEKELYLCAFDGRIYKFKPI